MNWIHNKNFATTIKAPDPETKEDYIQKSTILELILPKIEGLEYGLTVEIALKKDQLAIIANEPMENRT